MLLGQVRMARLRPVSRGGWVDVVDLGAAARATARPTVRAGSTTASTAVRLRRARSPRATRSGGGSATGGPGLAHAAPRDRRLGAARPPARRAGGRAHTAPARPRWRAPGRPAAPTRSHEPGPSSACSSTGRLTCQARVERSSALAWSSPPEASSPAATVPSAGDGSTTYWMPCVGQPGDDGRARPRGQRLHVGVEVGVGLGRGEDLVLADGDAVAAAHGVGEAVLDAAADDQDPVGGAALGVLDHVRRDAGVAVVGELARPLEHEPGQPEHRDHGGDGGERRRAPGVRSGVPVRRARVASPWMAMNAATTKAPRSTTRKKPSPGRASPTGQVEADRAQGGRGDRRDERDDPHHQHGDPGARRDQGEHRHHDQGDAEPPGRAEVAGQPAAEQVVEVEGRARAAGRSRAAGCGRRRARTAGTHHGRRAAPARRRASPPADPTPSGRASARARCRSRRRRWPRRARRRRTRRPA